MSLCRKHKVVLLCPACLGESGGTSTSPTKSASSRENIAKAREARRKKFLARQQKDLTATA
jgi:hypothetical protein